MKYEEVSFHSAWFPKMLGTYEQEIYPWIEEAIASPPDRVIVVGAAEGYYAVGLASRLPAASVVAFESETAAHLALARIAVRNGVDQRIEMHSTCGPRELRHALRGARRPLLFMDAEGSEVELLDPEQVPELASVRIVVELHEWIRPGIGAEIRRRFAGTHRIDTAEVECRRTGDIRSLFLRLLLLARPEYAGAWLDEGRPTDQLWLRLTPQAPEESS